MKLKLLVTNFQVNENVGHLFCYCFNYHGNISNSILLSSVLSSGITRPELEKKKVKGGHLPYALLPLVF